MFFEVDIKNLVIGKEYTIVSSYDKGIYNRYTHTQYSGVWAKV